jgi:uncharacterized protein with HEPN domain
MKGEDSRNPGYLSLGIQHLQIALRYSERGRRVFFDEGNPDTARLVEAELRKAYESLNRLGASFWSANPTLPRDRIGQTRQLLTHDYAGVELAEIWRIVSEDARSLLHLLMKAKVPAPRS